MTEPQHRWTDDQFEQMSWHDNHVHGLQIVEGEFGAGQLIIDLDYIVEWVKDNSGGCRFRLLPVALTFQEVTFLRISLDYATPTAGLCPFSLHDIERRTEQRERYEAQVWKLLVNWPAGEISFEAKGFVQQGAGEPVLSDQMYLSPEERAGFTRAVPG
mgnify:CR=1 FL=1